MSTLVKIVVESGVDGRIVHTHGGSGFHPAHRMHNDSRGVGAESHAAERADVPSNAGVLNTEALKAAYAACLQGIEQEPWATFWTQKKAAIRGGRNITRTLAAAPVESSADKLARLLAEVAALQAADAESAKLADAFMGQVSLPAVNVRTGVSAVPVSKAS